LIQLRHGVVIQQGGLAGLKELVFNQGNNARVPGPDSLLRERDLTPQLAAMSADAGPSASV
jgi:hypothetical protein